ncbi:hypothetical protein Bca4012_009753 [Brassica carinata]
MVHPLTTTTITSQIHPSSPGSCSHKNSLSLARFHSKEVSRRSPNEPESKREWSQSCVGFYGLADSVFEASMVAAEVELCGKGGRGVKS